MKNSVITLISISAFCFLVALCLISKLNIAFYVFLLLASILLFLTIPLSLLAITDEIKNNTLSRKEKTNIVIQENTLFDKFVYENDKIYKLIAKFNHVEVNNTLSLGLYPPRTPIEFRKEKLANNENSIAVIIFEHIVGYIANNDVQNKINECMQDDIILIGAVETNNSIQIAFYKK